MSVQTKVVTILSGGMDSTTLLYDLHEQDFDQHALSFDYGQRHRKELAFADWTCHKLGIRHDVLELSLGKLLKGSALTDRTVEVPHGHYAAENMKSTVVPNRNAVMLSIAWAVAVSEGARYVALGVHSGDHPIYPDCRPGFLALLEQALRLGNQGFGNSHLRLMTPYVSKTKVDIVRRGMELKTPPPYEDTWSCYEGGEVHCGQCGTCVERIEAFRLAGVPDPTTYAQPGLPVSLRHPPLG